MAVTFTLFVLATWIGAIVVYVFFRDFLRGWRRLRKARRS